LIVRAKHITITHADGADLVPPIDSLDLGGSRAVALENLARRQQLAALSRTVKRPQLRARDRLFWIVLAKVWQGWRTAVIFVQPDTVVR
jgi:hypothetical protein